jgi:hypothetical protein
MRQARALGCEHGVLQSPNLVLPETPLQHRNQPVFAVQTVRVPTQTSLAADMKLGITGQPTVLTISPSFHPYIRTSHYLRDACCAVAEPDCTAMNFVEISGLSHVP